MRRAFVGGRGLVAGVGGLGHLRLGTGQAVGELRDLPGKLQDDPVLLLHMALQEGQAFFEVAQAVIHGSDDARRGRRGKPMPGAYDKYDSPVPGASF